MNTREALKMVTQSMWSYSDCSLTLVFKARSVHLGLYLTTHYEYWKTAATPKWQQMPAFLSDTHSTDRIA